MSKWTKCQLGEALTFQRGYDITKKQQREGAYYVISSSGPKSTHAEYKVKGPGVIIGRKGTLGSVFYSDENYWPHDTSLWVKDFHGNDPKFAYYLLQTMGFEKLDVGAANPSLNRNHIHTIPVDIPDLSTQHRIAGILSAYDDLIENNLRRIKILEDMAQSLYREWFVHFRFPGHESTKMQDSPLGPIPEGWEVKRLKGVASVNGQSIRKSSAPKRINYIDIKSVSTGGIDEIRPMAFEEAPSRARRIVQHGDIIWSTVRPNRRSFSIIIEPEENLIASTGFAVLSAQEVPWTYLYQATTTEDFTSYLVNHASGAAYPAVNAKIFEDAKLVIPSSELLSKFNDTVESLELQQRCLLNRNNNLRKTRDLLLPKLLTPS